MGLICEKKKIQSVLVDCQRGIGGTLRLKPLTWGHGSNFGSPGIWVVTQSLGCRARHRKCSFELVFLAHCDTPISRKQDLGRDQSEFAGEG